MPDGTRGRRRSRWRRRSGPRPRRGVRSRACSRGEGADGEVERSAPNGAVRGTVRERAPRCNRTHRRVHRSGPEVARCPRPEATVRPPEEVAGSVAANLRRLRAARGLTLDAVAERAEVSKNTVIQVEQARANPSIATLCRLADALGVGVASLIAAPPSPRVTVRRAEDTPTLWSSEDGSEANFCLGTDPPQIVELWDWTLAPGDGFDGEAHPVGTIEILLVLEGQLAVHVGEAVHHLDVRDSVLFEAEVAHRYANPGDTTTRFVMSVLQPTGTAALGLPTTIAPAAEVGPSRDRPAAS
ncbi:helix-turn-helix domain-containing protein [Nitriliruptoraceae bacterium ZYF776]|nr:helix-turn-helix domain-containing protein [Profundirhabdus halotolerans]